MNSQATFSNTPFWHDDVDLSVTTTPLEALKDTLDIVIVGSGFTGLSAALTLARAGKSVTIIEKNNIASGASSRNGGLLGPSFHKLGIQGLVNAFGNETANNLLKESLLGYDWLLNFIKDEQIDCDLRQCGRFRGALQPAHFKPLAEQAESFASKLDYPVTIVEKSQQHSEVGSDLYHGGVVYEKDAALNPAKLVKGLIQRCQAAGVTFVEQTQVSEITQNSTGFSLIANTRLLKASTLLIATNGYTGAVTQQLKRRILPIRSSMIATEPLSASLINSISPRQRTHGGTDRLVFYYRTSPDGKRLLFGGRALSYKDKPQEYYAFLQHNMRTLFPQLQEAKISHAWSGLVAYSFDHIPHLGVQDGMYYAMGYCGSGVARANYLGHKIALQMLGKEGATAFDNFDFPSKALYSGNPWFMPFLLRWHSLADKWGM
ncbi:MAG: FAD-binding oxidoreductase [Oceanospirillaceae bacterium]